MRKPNNPENLEFSLVQAPSWNVHPFQFVSLWEMVVKFEAGEVYQDVLALRLMLDDISSYIRRYNGGKYLDECPELKQSIRSRLNAILVTTRRYPLARTVESVEDLHLIEPDIKTSETLSGLQKSIEQVQSSLEKDLWEYLFLFVPSDRVEYYNQAALFGDAVNRKFKKAVLDIKQAGNCYTIQDYDGCVFHLVRVLEHGLRKLAKRLSVPCALKPSSLDLQTWGTVIKQIEDAIKLMPHAKDQRESRRLQFFNDAASQFSFSKDAWRDVYLHSRNPKVQDAKVLSFLTNVKGFMQVMTRKI